MKILHIADLHIGKKLHGLSLLDSGDQAYWLEQLLAVIRDEKPQAILIAGDLYDRSNPSREAIEFVGNMLSEFSALEWNPAILVVAGNHDSGPLVEYMCDVVRRQNIYVAGTTEKIIPSVTLSDEYGDVVFWLVPYVFPAEINRVLETDFREYDEAFRAYLAAQDIDFSKRNVILSHQNVTVAGNEAERGGSETMVGGVGGIDYTAFEGFEYTALGHIHAAQKMGRDNICYAGSPLCYHFDELRRPDKGPVLVTLGAKGVEPEINIRKLTPLHPLRIVPGTMSEIEAQEIGASSKNEYIRVILKPETDENGIIKETGNENDRLRAIFNARGSLVLETVYERPTHAFKALGSDTSAKPELPVEDCFSSFWTERRSGVPDVGSTELLRFIAEQERNSYTVGIEPTEAETNEILAYALKQEV